jgi:hypothetical protein
VAAGTSIGFTMGAIDAALADDATYSDILMGGLMGAATGFIVGFVAPFIHPGILLGIGLPVSSYGVYDAYTEGNTVQSLFRLITGPVLSVLTPLGYGLPKITALRVKVLNKLQGIFGPHNPSNPLSEYIRTLIQN